MEDLRRLNFENLISVAAPDVSAYTYDEYRNNGHEHLPINRYCVSCEDQGCNLAKNDKSFCLTNISHGAHSSDFFRALKKNIDVSDWHQQPLLFVYETPSRNYGIYKEVVYKGFKKRPSKDWYWIHDDLEPVSYPDRFCGGEYGGFVLSAILTFRLANVYITNLVKCGLNNKRGEFRGLAHYDERCVEKR